VSGAPPSASFAEAQAVISELRFAVGGKVVELPARRAN